MTFDQCADAYIRAHEPAWRNAKHRQQWRKTLATYVSPVFGAVSVADVDVAVVLKVVEPLRSSKPETANRVRGRTEAILDWAKARGYRLGEIPLGGAATSTSCCRRSRRCGRSNTMPRSLTPR